MGWGKEVYVCLCVYVCMCGVGVGGWGVEGRFDITKNSFKWTAACGSTHVDFNSYIVSCEAALSVVVDCIIA